MGIQWNLMLTNKNCYQKRRNNEKKKKVYDEERNVVVTTYLNPTYGV